MSTWTSWIPPKDREMASYFISHAAPDADAGALIRDTILDIDSGNPEVFLSTRPGDIPGGEPWLSEIRNRLDQAEHVFVLLTPVSVKRWWVWFEAGAAWLRHEKTMVPVLAGELSPSQVPEPLRLLQLYSLEDPAQAVAAFQRVGLQLSSARLFATSMRAATLGSRQADLLSQGWESIDVGGVTYIWGGPAEGFRTAAGIPAPADLLHALGAKGIHKQFGIQRDLSNEEGKGMAQVFQLSNGNVLRPLLHESQVLLAMRDGYQRS